MVSDEECLLWLESAKYKLGIDFTDNDLNLMRRKMENAIAKFKCNSTQQLWNKVLRNSQLIQEIEIELSPNSNTLEFWSNKVSLTGSYYS